MLALEGSTESFSLGRELPLEQVRLVGELAAARLRASPARAPRCLAWEGGIPGVVTGQHSFLLDPHDGGTRFTDSEVFSGPAAVEAVEPNRAKMEKNSATYGRALKERLESGH